ncbi:MAG: SBBP repeat-containing protein, partial [Chloroflexi bacterium]|nr:SBBP repeat-containing protein [Chloroflexota bacterium]
MKPKLARLGRLLVILALGTILFPAVTTPAGAEGQPQTLVSPIEKQVSIAEAAQSAPLMFVENAGQMDSQARYEVMGANSTLYLADDALWYNVVEESKAGSSLEKGQGPGIESQDSRAAEQPRRGVNLKVSFVGANPRPRLEPFNRLETDVSYFIGNDPAKWRPDVPVWGGVRYVDLYPGIDLELSGENGQLVQRMVAKSGANLDAVNLRIEGMDGLMLEGNHLLLSTQVGNLALPLLQTNSTSNDSTLAAPMGPTVQGGIVSHPFTSPSADAPAADETLVVSTLLGYSTFLGGGQDDSVNAIAVDGSGAAYVTGATNSTTGVSNFPKTPGTFPMGLHSEGFVVKFNPAGTALTYATFIGGSGWYDIGRAIAVDSTGHAFVAGQTDSNNFPTSVSAYDRTLGGSLDAFVTKLNPTGTAVDYSTYLGGAGQERAFGLAIDGQGAAYVAGETSSVGDFPVTVGAPQGSHTGSTYDGFIAKLNAAGSARVYATYLGSKEMDHIYGLAIDSSGSAYVTGETYTSASAPNFPVTGAAYDKIPNGGYEAFVTKLNAAGTAWAYSTYLGGTDYERGYAIAVDSTGAAYVAGETNSNFPTTAGAYRTTPVGGYDGFVTKLNSTGSALVYSTLLGGANWDTISALRLDTSGGAYVAGTTYSTNFPTTSTAYDRSFNLGSKDAFVAGIDPTGTALAYGSYLGGNAYDLGNAIAIDNAGGIYVAGATYSSNFPTSTTAYDKTFNAGATSDGFVTKLLLNKAVFLPVIIDNAYGGWNTGISIRNP